MRYSGATHGIGVIIDVHAANGSQNGYDHSAPTVVNGRGQQLWDSKSQPTPDYPAQAVSLVATLAARYAAAPALLGISVLNEPNVRPAPSGSEPDYSPVRPRTLLPWPSLSRIAHNRAL